MGQLTASLRPTDVNVPEPTDGAPPWESPAWLADELTRWSPDDAPPVIAVDRERRWALTHNVGERLDGLLKRDPDIRNMHMPLRRYARLQRKLAAHVNDLLELGVPDGRPEHIEELLDSILSPAPRGLIGDDVLRLDAHVPVLPAHAEALEERGILARQYRLRRSGDGRTVDLLRGVVL